MTSLSASNPPLREYYVLQWSLNGMDGSDRANCLRLFTSRDEAEDANERSAEEASERYYWPYAKSDPTEYSNGRGERIFRYSGETYEKTFTVETIRAMAICDNAKRNNSESGDEDAHYRVAYGIVTNHILGGDGKLEDGTMTHDHVFVGMDKEAVRSAAIAHARAFANELVTTKDPSWFDFCTEACHEDLLVVKEGPGGRRHARGPQQEGDDSCLTLRIETAVNPNHDYEEDGYEDYAEDYFPTKCATIKVMEMAIGKPTEDEFSSNEFYEEWTQFPGPITTEMRQRQQKRSDELRRQLEESMRRQREIEEGIIPAPPIPQWQLDFMRLRPELFGRDRNNESTDGNNAQDGS